MAKTKVGGTSGLIDQLLILVGWTPTTVTSSPQRLDALRHLNYAEQYISQYDGLLHLQRRETLTIANTTDYALLPTTPPMDFGKDFVVLQNLGKGRIDIVAAADFSTTYGSVDGTTGPSQAYLATDPADGVMKLWFDYTNTTGAGVTLKIVYQQMVNPLIDAATGTGSESLLPEGYELTLLLRKAELSIKLGRHDPAVEKLSANFEQAMEMFYTKFRSNKDEPVTDRNRERRKVELDQLTPERRR